MTVIIGPNNVGKSRVLKDIAGKTTQEPSFPGIVVTDVEWEFPSSLQEFREACSIERHFENGQWMFRTLTPELSGEYSTFGLDWPTEYEKIFDTFRTNKVAFVQHFGQAMVAFLTTEHRLQLVKECASKDPDKQEATLLQALFNGGSQLEIRINELVKRVFGKEIKLDFTTLQRLLLRVGDSFSTVPPDPRDAKPLMNKYDKLDDQGDGIRSFIGILSALLAIKRNVFLIDEPEAFLHPPQAFRIGEFLAGQANSSRQIILATHSTDLLRGILSKTTDVTILRIDRKDQTNSFHTLNPNDLHDLVNNPLLSSARVIDGFFYTGVVVVEGDRDARFYQTACNKFRNNTDFHFVNADNKQRVSEITRTYRDMRVRCVGIVDFDVLNNHAEFEKQLESLELNQEQTQSLLDIRQKIAEAAEEIPADKRLEEVKEKITHILTCVNDIQNQSFASESEKQKLLRQLESRFTEIADTTKNWKEFKEKGRAALPANLQSEFDSLWEICSKKGLFINPCGELESMMTQQGIPYTKNNKKGWIKKALQKLPKTHVNETEYPWQFIKQIQEHLQ
ncbi:MAG: AAA family ATPase [Nostoc sp. TH1S01]|nr:AAA family ATPase [Nostoc sp. TH1S01]